MIHPRVALLATLVLLGASTVGDAAVMFTATLTNEQEPQTPVPVIPTLVNGTLRPKSFGTATFLLNDAMTELTMTATVFNIDFTNSQTADVNDNLTNAHIHAGATPGAATFPVVWGFIGSPFNDNNPRDVVVTPFATGVGGTVTAKWDAPEGQNTTLTAQLPNIFAGRSYINFHTVQFGGGEVRGQLVTPEPSSIALAGMGAIGLIGYGWLRPRRTR